MVDVIKMNFVFILSASFSLSFSAPGRYDTAVVLSYVVQYSCTV
jgi:hypothetical protein